jgi:SAM-dependent methyltransferase
LNELLLSTFKCPACGGLEAREDAERLTCEGCAREFPVVGGIPRFVEIAPGASRQVQQVFDFEHRRYEDSAYTQFHPRLVDQFLGECELRRDFFAGKRALDGGCGSGRWTYALAELGARVMAVDLTAGGPESARAALDGRPEIDIAQADLFDLPFRPESFDFVMSWGVLHHTRDTREAFGRLVPLLKPGGTLFVMVYEVGSKLREHGTNALRFLMRRLSDEQRYRACRLLVIRNPYLAQLLSPFFIVTHLGPDSPIDVSTAQFGLFDAYSPRWNHLHSTDEVVGWFEAAGLEDVKALSTPGAVRVRGRKPA